MSSTRIGRQRSASATRCFMPPENVHIGRRILRDPPSPDSVARDLGRAPAEIGPQLESEHHAAEGGEPRNRAAPEHDRAGAWSIDRRAVGETSPIRFGSPAMMSSSVTLPQPLADQADNSPLPISSEISSSARTRWPTESFRHVLDHEFGSTRRLAPSGCIMASRSTGQVRDRAGSRLLAPVTKLGAVNRNVGGRRHARPGPCHQLGRHRRETRRAFAAACAAPVRGFADDLGQLAMRGDETAHEVAMFRQELRRATSTVVTASFSSTMILPPARDARPTARPSTPHRGFAQEQREGPGWRSAIPASPPVW